MAREDFTVLLVLATENKIARRLRIRKYLSETRLLAVLHPNIQRKSRRPPGRSASSARKPGQDVIAQKGAERPVTIAICLQ